MDPLLPVRRPLAASSRERHRAELVARVAEPTTAAPPAVQQYRLRARLGRGATAEVWEAEDDGGNRVALKLFPPRPTDDARQRTLTREVRASRRLQHPGLVRVLDVGLMDGRRPFLVMELLSGHDLGEVLSREGSLPWPRARALLLQLCDALAYAHDQGVMHRDLKPTNIMIVPEDDGSERAVVVDLGLSRVLGDSVVSTLDGSLVGTPAYMSPEQIRGATVDHRADVYALGCIAFEMLSGRRPFGGQTPGECAVQHLVAEPPRLRVVGPRARRRSIEAVVRRALAKDPHDRFADMRALRAAIERADRAEGSPAPRSALVGGAALLGAGALALGYSLRSDAPPPTTITTEAAVPLSTRTTEVARRRVVDLAVGLSHSCAVSDDGRATCWGIDTLGRQGRSTEGRNIGDNETPASLPPLPLTGVESIHTAPNGRHVCTRHRDGAVRCWGDGRGGGTGRGSPEPFGARATESLADLPPLPLPGPASMVAMALGRTCAIVERDGRRELYCWGRGTSGALGLGSTDDVGDDESLEGLEPVPLGTDVIEVAMGHDHTCARLDTGAIRCWGSGARGQLGVVGWTHDIGDGVGDRRGRGERPDDPELDVQGLDGFSVVAMDAGGDRTCVLGDRGGVRCWGSAEAGGLGHPRDELPGCQASDDDLECSLAAPLPFDVDLGGAFVVGLSVGRLHTCVVDDEGHGRCWGQGGSGRLGDGGSEDLGLFGPPRQRWQGDVLGGAIDVGDADGDGLVDPIAAIEAGMLHTCALMVAGSVRCWGSGAEGRLGYGSTDDIGHGMTPGDDYAARGRHDVAVFSSR